MATPAAKALELPRALALNVLELQCPGVHEMTRLPRPESREVREDLQRRLGQALYVTSDNAHAAGHFQIFRGP